MDIDVTFGRWLRQRRRWLDLTQADLAEQVGCSEITIRKLEADERIPSARVAEQLAACLKIPTIEHPSFVAFARRYQTAAPPRLQTQRLSEPAATRSTKPLSPLTQLHGRDKDVAAIMQRLMSPHLRLLTLVGPPGIGKTRLCLHIADSLRLHYADGVCFVALAPIRDPAHVVPTLLQSIGSAASIDQPPAAALHAALRDRQMLLVLDNFEHVVASATQISQLLRTAPQIKILITSRSALGIKGEHLYTVPPLALPDLSTLPPIDELIHYPAIQLFTERVRAVRPDFVLTAHNAPAVAEICARLDGLPLAIELAAARSKLFTPQALLERLYGSSRQKALTVLVNGPRDLLTHQRTLRSTIGWSYDLLDRDEQAVFIQLGIFANGWTLEAAEAICPASLALPDDRRNRNAERSTLAMLTSFVNQSLLQVDLRSNGEARFSMLETIREYALEKLEASGALQATQARHASYYAALVHSIAPHLNGTRQEVLIKQLDADYHNLRAALDWLATHEPELAAHCAIDLYQFWHKRGLMNEGRAWLARLLGHAETAGISPAVQAHMLCAAGSLAYQQCDPQQAERLSSESLALYRALGHQHGIASALMNLGGVAFSQGDYPRAIAIYNECLAIYQALSDTAGIAYALRCLALTAKDQGDLARAVLLLEESLRLYREIGDLHGVAKALFNLSTSLYWQGDYARSGTLAEEVERICRELGDQMFLAYALEGIGMVRYKQGDHVQALQTLEESLEIFRTLGEREGIALVLNEMGLISYMQGNHACAAQLHQEALLLAWRSHNKRRIAFCLEGLAAAIGSHQPLHAARLFGAAEALREAIGAPLPPTEHSSYTQYVAIARDCAAAAAFTAAWSEGRKLPLTQVVTEVLTYSCTPETACTYRL